MVYFYPHYIPISPLLPALHLQVLYPSPYIHLGYQPPLEDLVPVGLSVSFPNEAQPGREGDPMAGHRVIDSSHHTHTIVRGPSWRPTVHLHECVEGLGPAHAWSLVVWFNLCEPPWAQVIWCCRSFCGVLDFSGSLILCLTLSQDSLSFT